MSPRLAKPNGICRKCKQVFTKRKMKTHLQSCFSGSIGKPMLCLLVEGGGGYFWLYVVVEENATLNALDKLLRDVWLECCGHPSAFYTPFGTYDSNPEESGELGMDKAKVKKAIQPEMGTRYEYDFGSTTELFIRFVEEINIKNEKRAFVLARNEPLEVDCGKCHKNPASFIDAYEQRKLFCKECSKDIDEEETPLLPLVNSPRAGVCGYMGEINEND